MHHFKHVKKINELLERLARSGWDVPQFVLLPIVFCKPSFDQETR
jgi:hypothetical protein